MINSDCETKAYHIREHESQKPWYALDLVFLSSNDGEFFTRFQQNINNRLIVKNDYTIKIKVIFNDLFSFHCFNSEEQVCPSFDISFYVECR